VPVIRRVIAQDLSHISCVNCFAPVRFGSIKNFGGGNQKWSDSSLGRLAECADSAHLERVVNRPRKAALALSRKPRTNHPRPCPVISQAFEQNDLAYIGPAQVITWQSVWNPELLEITRRSIMHSKGRVQH